MRILIVLCALTFASRGFAEPGEPIVLVSGDPAFEAALASALAPAGMSVATASDAPPSTIDISNTSRAIADREHASSTVWLLFDTNGSTLITYDRGVDRVLVRSLHYVAPLTAAQAAEAASMARTMLRALRVTPDIDLPPPRAADAAAVRARAAAEPRAPMVHERDRLALDGTFGVRLGAPAADAALGGTLAAIWRPDRLGAALAISAAPGAPVRASTFMGSIADDSIAISVRLPVRVADRFVVVGTAGPALHLVRLTGELSGSNATTPRFDPAAHVGVSLQYDLGTFAISVGVSADWLIRRQAYDVGTLELVGMSPVQMSAGLGLMARIL